MQTLDITQHKVMSRVCTQANESGEAKLCVLPLTRLTVNEHGKSILRRAVNEIFQGRRNVSNIRGAESREAPPWYGWR